MLKYIMRLFRRENKRGEDIKPLPYEWHSAVPPTTIRPPVPKIKKPPQKKKN